LALLLVVESLIKSPDTILLSCHVRQRTGLISGDTVLSRTFWSSEPDLNQRPMDSLWCRKGWRRQARFPRRRS
ncbi:hypothetical protein T05_14846, partial [Trichinella murrelli]